MISKLEIAQINKDLIHKYGMLFDKPRFRLVWSEEQFEIRHGEVEVWYGEIFVRKESGAHHLKKYNYLKERWILESLVVGINTEIEKTLSYEPIWVFQDNKGNYLDPNNRAINLIIFSYLNPEKLTPGQLESEEASQLAKEVSYFENYLAGELTYTASMLANREAVVVPKDVKLGD